MSPGYNILKSTTFEMFYCQLQMTPDPGGIEFDILSIHPESEPKFR